MARRHAGASSSLLSDEAGLALSAHTKNDDRVQWCEVLIEGYVSGRAPPNDELALSAFHDASDHWARLQNVERLDDRLDPLLSLVGGMPQKVRQDAVEVLIDADREDYFRHERARGERAFFPDARSLR